MAASVLDAIKEQLQGCSDAVYQSINIHGQACMLIYIPSIVDTLSLQEFVASPLKSEANGEPDWPGFLKRLDHGSAFAIPYIKVYEIDRAVELAVSGNAVLCIEGMPFLYYFEIAHYQKRAVSESQNELVVIGPQEAFIEDVATNLSLLRHKIKHADLKTKHFSLGKYTKTDVYLVYIEGLYKPEILAEIEEVLVNLNMDGVLGISYIAEHIKQGKFSPFPVFQYTERPDSVAASLMEGRVGILQDGTPSALLTPVTFMSLLQSSEDYYQSFYAGSWIRLVRFLFSIIALVLPAFYIAVTTFHSQIIPSDLLLTIAAARENIPFSALTEALIMELTFEALREAGTRIPKPVGQTVSIIGGIVIGQAAVQAGIVSAPMVIVVSITGIASYIIPHLELGLTFRLLRFVLLVLGGTMGLLGVIVAVFIIYGHLVHLKSFGTPYMQPLAPLILEDWKDTLLRVPNPFMTKRSTSFTGSTNDRRQRSK
ncbi:spore gernimation protein GerA [Paenibacillus sp. FSL R7-0273]|uniref:spore germination protein n=1 Tax=Paenibacillus sp. FSL R7-0273 TaxID=1536772 RepID=UPI0004F8810C|nr:spore germination protein [Paenibacillus sp. FSL R7-0273]AIQ47058.1 spore gernimation protein GerA [Paenibacillus sp. FSL R7-0273]OMF97187.1 spore germination protein [Paenibacillus sp. FSL R7-0273]